MLDRQLALLASRGVNEILESGSSRPVEKTVAIVSSRFSASSARREAGEESSASNRPKTTVSANTEAVSASVSGVL